MEHQEKEYLLNNKNLGARRFTTSLFPHTPERRSIMQTGMDNLHTWACVTIFRPALFDDLP